MYRYTAKVGDGGLVVNVSDFKIKGLRGFKPHMPGCVWEQDT